MTSPAEIPKLPLAELLIDELKKASFTDEECRRILDVCFPVFIGRLGISPYLPTPEMLNQYEQISPGLALKVLDMTERELGLRQEGERRTTGHGPSFQSMVFANYFAIIIAILGFVAAVTILATGFPDFIKAFALFGPRISHSSLFIHSAFAQTVSTQQGSNQPTPPVAPVFIYGVYVLLAIAYLASLYHIFFGKDERDKATALELFKNLNAFFIGAITGKFV